MGDQTPKRVVRDFFRARGGRALLGDLYAHAAGQAAENTVRRVSRTVEEMLATGELREHPGGEYSLEELPETRGRRGNAHNRLWRAAHRLCERRAAFSRADLERLARVSNDAARRWLEVQRRQGRVEMLGRRGAAWLYRLAPEQPGPEDPPPFRWPRRGKARTRRDLEGAHG